MRKNGSFTKLTALWYTIPIAAFAGLGTYLLLKNSKTSGSRKPHDQADLPIHGEVPPPIADRLPLAKNLETIPDQVGNYDIDGVSFDAEGVIVSSDQHKHASL